MNRTINTYEKTVYRVSSPWRSATQPESFLVESFEEAKKMIVNDMKEWAEAIAWNVKNESANLEKTEELESAYEFHNYSITPEKQRYIKEEN